MSRIAGRFAELQSAHRAAFIPFITAGDPDFQTSLEILKKLPQAGADVIELGVPFSDPMADGPAVQAASQRALKSGMSLAKVLEMVRAFRGADSRTPLVLMGYTNPVHAFGIDSFVEQASRSGVDGLITVDLPPEEDEILREPAAAHGLDVIRLATPTTDDARLATILHKTSGFLYYVSVAGVTGANSFSTDEVRRALARIRIHAQIPIAVGFGIKTPEQAAEIARFADGAVVGSAIVARIGESASAGDGRLVEDVVNFCATLARAVHSARTAATE